MNTTRQNQVLEQLIDTYCPADGMGRKRNGNGGVIIQPGYLQSEYALVNGKNQYPVIINQNGGGTPRASERRLNQNDLFVALFIAFRLKQEDSTKPGQAQLQAYANPSAIIPEATLTQLDADAMFNSSLSVKVGDTVFAEAIDLSPCRVVGTTAQTSASTRSELHSNEGVIEVVKYIAFDGGKKNELYHNLQYAGLIQSAAAVTTVYGVIKMWGFQVTGVSK